MKISSLVLAALIAISGSAISAAPETPTLNRDVFDLVSGKWAWTDKPDHCKENPHFISFSPDRKTAFFRVEKPFEVDGKMVTEYSYTVLYSEGNTITMFVNGEKRRTNYGDRVVWVLILKDPTTYAWRRTDWPPNSATPDVGRCDHIAR
jgi:hypothetical protein